MTSPNAHTGSPWRKLIPSRPFVFLFLTFLTGLVFFSLFRLLFLLSFTDRIEGVPVAVLVKAFAVGVRFDQIVVLFVLLPLLLVLPWLSPAFRATKVFVLGYLGIIFGALFLGLLADIPFFKVFASRLNFQAIEYLSGGRTTWHLILTEPKFYVSLVLLSLAVIAFLVSVGFVLRWTRNIPFRRAWWAQVGLLAAGLALSFLGIRGRVQLSPIDWSAAYISQNQFVNQLGLNGVYTMARAYMEEGHDPRIVYLPESERFPFAPFSDALTSVQSMLEQPGERWLNPDSSLRRETLQPGAAWGFAPNIIIVCMESFSGRDVGALGSGRRLTPNFDRLASGGILFTNFYGNGTRTNFGLAATLCSYPSIPGRSVMSRYHAAHPFMALSQILHQRGYVNAFAYGGDLVFDNMEGFFREKGYDRFYGDTYFGLENVFAKWGIPDEIIFEKVAALTDSLPRPFQMTVLTLSNHEPFDLPDSSVRAYFDDADSSKLFNAIRYADFAIGRLVAEISSKPVFDSTIFVFVSDHAHYGTARLTVDPTNFQIPLLIYSPALLGTAPRQIEATGSQVDILPTLMGLLGDPYVHESWGRNLLDLPANDPGFAIVNVLNWVGYIEKDRIYFETVGKAGKLIELGGKGPSAGYKVLDSASIQDEFRRRLHDYLQLADQLSTPATPEKLQ